ncbi:MAG: hypothetical protein MUF71_08150 [Candidatus Kapabacteria bacterium]|jgi:hypothetical protein|nr:hypothetical protein [Candidatus Kapabacteria bacterium]
MNPTSNHNAPENPQNLAAACEELMQEALAGTLTDAESMRLTELFRSFPQLHSEFVELQSITERCRAIPSPNNNTDEWQNLENRINTRLEALLAQSPTKSPTSKPLTLIQRLPGRQVFIRTAALAAMFVGGIFVGLQTNNSSLEAQSQQQATVSLTSNSLTTNDEELTNFLHDAHLLMLGVMAMNAECGLPHPQTLVAQRERCVELLSRAQSLRQNLPPQERQHFTQVIMQVESALAELAATQPSLVNAGTIRNIQHRTDDALCEVTTLLAASRQ